MPTTDTFESGVNWTVGDLVTAETLKNTIEDATPKPPLISSLGVLSGDVDGADQLMILDQNLNQLKKVTFASLFTSNLPNAYFQQINIGGFSGDGMITTSQEQNLNGFTTWSIGLQHGGQQSDTGTYSCVNGVVTISITGSINQPEINDVVEVTQVTGNGDATIFGTFLITSIGSGTFNYLGRNPSVANSAGTCTFQNKGAVKIYDNNSSFGASGNIVTENAYVTGDLEVNDDSTINGDLDVRGNAVVTGVTNLKGDVQYNGTPVYSLYEIVDETMSAQTFNLTSTLTDANVWKSVHTKSNLTKTNKEIWIVEIDVGYYQYCYNAQGFYTGLAYHKIKRNGSVNHLAWVQTGSAHLNSGFSNHLRMSATIPQNVTFTNDTFTYEAYYRWAGAANAGAVLHIGYAGFQQDVCQRSFRIYKYIKG